jgi:hypothetical protein
MSIAKWWTRATLRLLIVAQSIVVLADMTRCNLEQDQ